MKCGNRPNLIYPISLIVFTLGRRIIEFLMSKIYDYSGRLVLSFLIFFSEFIGGFLFNLIFPYKEKKSPITNIHSQNLIQGNNELDPRDSIPQIFLLIFIASSLDFIGSIIRRYIIPLKITKSNEIFEHSIRSLQILFSSILCFLLLKIKIGKHQICSLIIIFICITIIGFIEFTYLGLKSDSSSNKKEIISFFLACYSCLQRACMDIIHKYLFEYNFVNPYKLLIIQGGINVALTIPFYFLKYHDNNEEISDFLKLMKTKYFLIALIVLYLIVSMFKNIYIVFTIKIFSPMTRALSESCFDCFIIPYYLWDFRDIKYFWIFFFVIILFTALMNFWSFVYNEFIIIYCCGMEVDAHVEIIKRSDSFNNSLSMSKIVRDTMESRSSDNQIDKNKNNGNDQENIKTNNNENENDSSYIESDDNL